MKYLTLLLSAILLSCSTYIPPQTTTATRQIRIKEVDPHLRVKKKKKPRTGPLECGVGEVSLFNNEICARVCPAGMGWADGECQGYAYFHVYDEVLNKCKQHDEYYRLINMDEIVSLLGECQHEFVYNKKNYCSAFLLSPAKNVFKPPNSAFSTWTGDMIVCDDRYGYIGKNCSWEVMFYTKSYIRSEFNLLRASKEYGSAMSGGICVREK